MYSLCILKFELDDVLSECTHHLSLLVLSASVIYLRHFIREILNLGIPQ